MHEQEEKYAREFKNYNEFFENTIETDLFNNLIIKNL